MVCAALVAPTLIMPAFVTPAHADDTAAMRAVLDRLSARDWQGATAVAPNEVARDLVDWTRLRAGDGLLGEYEAFLARRPDWPGLALLREKGEVAVARSTSPERVVAYFAGSAPQTGPGAVALV